MISVHHASSSICIRAIVRHVNKGETQTFGIWEYKGWSGEVPSDSLVLGLVGSAGLCPPRLLPPSLPHSLPSDFLAHVLCFITINPIQLLGIFAGPMPDQTQQQVDDAMSSPSSKNDSGRLILISNRLPITIKRSATGDYTFAASSGGLVSGISGLIKTKPFLWYGWPGIQIPKDEVQLVEQRLHDEHSAVPVFVPDKLADRHYNGFSNEIMWALLHYHTGEITFDESAWAAYVSVNRLFADRISRDLQEDDLVWIHDYHLMLLPGMIRERAEARNVNVKIGWFLHTPWPTSEVYQVLPVRNQVLEGLLQSDLIGFHTYDYTKHFLSTCNRLL